MKTNLFIIIICSLFFISGCRTKEIIIHDIQYRDRLQIDTVKVTEKDFVNVYQKGDTIYKETILTRYMDKITIKTDSVYKYKDKPVYIEKIKTVTVEKKLSRSQINLIKMGKAFLFFIGLWILVLIVKFRSPLKIFIQKLFK